MQIVTQETKRKYKEAILTCEIDKEVAKASYRNFVDRDYKAIEALRSVYGYLVVSIALQLNYARYKRKQRVSERIGKYIIEGECVFLTLTFKDEVFAKTSEKTRRRYVSRYLRQYCPHYVANIDFGGKKGREHYHAIVVGANLDYSAWHKFGAIKGEKVRSSCTDLERTCKYVVKLTNHAMKDLHGVAPRLLYSRKESPALK